MSLDRDPIKMARRGVLMVLEGCDRAGKSTQCKKLVKYLVDNNIKAKEWTFPGSC